MCVCTSKDELNMTGAYTVSTPDLLFRCLIFSVDRRFWHELVTEEDTCQVLQGLFKNFLCPDPFASGNFNRKIYGDVGFPDLKYIYEYM